MGKCSLGERDLGTRREGHQKRVGRKERLEGGHQKRVGHREWSGGICREFITLGICGGIETVW